MKEMKELFSKTKKLGRRKFIIVAVLLIFVMTTAESCESTEHVEKKEAPVLKNISGNSLELKSDIENGMELKVNYNTGGYDLSKWRVTDTKTINISAVVENIPEGCTVLMEHMHADISLAATIAQVDGLSQDSMDNSYHGYSQDGFFVNEKYPYNAIFLVEGFSKDIISGWGFVSGSSGSSEISSKRLTEKNLVESAGVYANKVGVEYSLNIKYSGEEYFHKVSVYQEFLVPVTYTED